MEIKKLLKSSKINWEGSIDSLEKDFESILNLLSSLPEPTINNIKYKNFAVLSKDEEGKEAKKSDIITNGDFFEI